MFFCQVRNFPYFLINFFGVRWGRLVPHFSIDATRTLCRGAAMPFRGKQKCRCDKVGFRHFFPSTTCAKAESAVQALEFASATCTRLLPITPRHTSPHTAHVVPDAELAMELNFDLRTASARKTGTCYRHRAPFLPSCHARSHRASTSSAWWQRGS